MKFIENPVGRELYKAGWQSKYLNRGRLSAILGSGVHAAIAEYYRPPGVTERGLEGDLEEIYNIAKNSVKTELDSLYRLGALVSTRDVDLASTLHLKARTVARMFIEQDIIAEYGFKVRNVELSMPDYGWCRLDMVVNPYPGNDDIIAGLDWKVKLRLDPRYQEKDITQFAFSWQFMHYAWALGKTYKTRIKEFYVGWICLEPKFRVFMLEYFIDEEIMQLWEQSATTVWALMAAIDGDSTDLTALLKAGDGTLPLWHTFNWFTRWGREEFANAVLDHKLHEEGFKQDYINTKREK